VEEMLNTLAGAEAHALLDVKPVNEAEAVIAELCALARNLAVEDKTVIGMRSMDWLATLRRASATVHALGLFFDPAHFAEFYSRGGDIGRLWEGNVSAETMLLCRGGIRGNYPVWITTQRDGTIDNPGHATVESLEALAGWGVDGVLVNDVALAQGIFDSLTETRQEGIKAAAPDKAE